VPMNCSGPEPQLVGLVEVQAEDKPGQTLTNHPSGAAVPGLTLRRQGNGPGRS
jgi:hypothetical protein